MRPSRPHVVNMLDEVKPRLDGIFGPGNYVVEKTGEYSALLKTALADFEVSDDPRDFVAASVTELPSIDVPQSPVDIWMRFLDVDIPVPRRSDSYAVQLAAELDWIAHYR